MSSVDEDVSKSLDNESKRLIADELPDVKNWINIRRGHRQSVTKTLKTVLSKSFSDLGELRALKEKCLKLQEKLSDLDSSICNEMLTHNLWRDDKCDQENANCESYMDDLRLCISKLELAIETLERSNNIGPPIESFNPKISLPKLQMPTFDGSPEKYSRFITQFEAIMSKFSISSFEKFTYLENQLSGSAKALLNAVPVDNMNYEAARKLLDKAFLGEDVQKFAVLDKLVNLRFNERDSYKWISDINMLKDQVDKLKIDAHFFVQYFAWNSLTEPFKNQLISITNVSRPSLSQIIDKAFEANTRMRDLKSLSSGTIQPRAITLATTMDRTLKKESVGGKTVQCTLCTKGDHFAKDCTVYCNPDEKLERAKSFSLCLKCARKQHNGKCFNLSRRCRKCNKWHFDYMCNAKPKETSKGKTPKKEETSKEPSKNSNPSTVSVESVSSSIVFPVNNNLENDVLLPTFTANLKGDGAQAEKRSVYDPWSQATFIKESLARELQCKVLHDVDLSVKGFNSCRNSKAKLVEVFLQVEDKNYRIKAVTVPKFDLAISAPKLGNVVETFKSKGYILADKHLGHDLIADIEFMLGSNYGGVLPVISRHFTDDEDSVPSCYLDTPLGVMLQGRAGLILKHAKGLDDLIFGDESA